MFFFIYADSGNSDQINFIFDSNKKKYYFTIEIPFIDDASFHSIVIDYNENNKNKIIKLFEKYYELISSL